MKILYIDCYYGFDASMLLGALIDAGASADEICRVSDKYSTGFNLEFSKSTACSIECTCAKAKCTTPSQRATETGLYDTACAEGILSALTVLGIDCVICSSVGVPDDTDGQIITKLDKSAIETGPSSGEYFCGNDALFLAHISSESGPMPMMDIISVGYGCREDITDSLVTVYTGTFDTFQPKEELNYEISYSQCQ